jgi:nitroreductase
MDYNGFLELVKNRRSIRRFKPDPIPDEYIDKIIEAARWAPSGYNTQPWDFVVVKDKKIKDSIVQLAPGARESMSKSADLDWKQRQLSQPWLDEDMDYSVAPVFIILLADNRAMAGLPGPRNINIEWARSIFMQSLSCAFVYMLQAATTLGLATQWVSYVGRSSYRGRLMELLGLPEALEPYFMMPVGYPAYKPRPKLLRPLEKMVHYDRSDASDFRTDEEVADFARRTWTWTTANHRRGTD